MKTEDARKNIVSYFNTTNQKGKVLNEHKLKADGQTKQILELFRSHGRPLAVYQVYNMLPDNWQFPISNVGRSITCLTPIYLTRLGKDKMIPGTYKRLCYVWELSAKNSLPF